MRRILSVFIMTVFLSAAGITVAADSDKDHAAWWIEVYGVVTFKENPLVANAERVFDRVYAAADKKGTRLPRLLIIRSDGDPWAQTIKDGTIIITEGALRICYRAVPTTKGDSRLAFILGHELAHLSKDDFWHNFAFAAVKEFADDKKTRKALMKQLDESDSQVKTKELQADSYGIITMTIAGYDPKSIIDDRTNFFKEWVSQVTGKIAYSDAQHSSSVERAASLTSQLKTVVKDLDLFTFGVRLYQVGYGYEDAIKLFEQFREKFPGREVFNNIGLSHYQLAFEAFSRCDETSAFEFKPSTVVDSDTLGSFFRTRGGGDEGDCFREENFQRHLREAIRNFELARDQDPSYIPARVNLSSALILNREYEKAMGVAAEALKLQPENSEALNNKAVALFLFGEAGMIDTADNAIGILKGILDKNASFGSAAYNIAAIQTRRGRSASAEGSYKQFLAIETTEPYADIVRKKLSIKAEGIKPQVQTLKSPFPLGDFGQEAKKRLKGAKHLSFNMGKFSGEIYEVEGMKILVIDDVVEMVEATITPSEDAVEFRKEHGEATRTIETTAGIVLIYGNFAADISDGKVSKMLYFVQNGGK